MEPEELPTEVTLRGRDGELRVRLVVPTSMALRYEVTYAVVRSEARAYGAALGLCSAAIRHHVRFHHDVMQYGSDVLDWLLGQGVAYLDALAAGRLAWVHVSRGLIDRREVDDAEGFSAPREEGSTS